MAGGKQTIDGIAVDISRDVFDDYEIAEAFAIIAEADEPGEKGEGFEVEFMKAAYSLPKMIFGADWKRIKSELRKRNGGRLGNADVFDFIKKSIEAAGAKN